MDPNGAPATDWEESQNNWTCAHDGMRRVDKIWIHLIPYAAQMYSQPASEGSALSTKQGNEDHPMFGQHVGLTQLK